MDKGARTRDRILDQAVRIASRDGLDGLSIGGLAAELGLSKSGLFAHFGSKDELQLQVLHAAVSRFADIVVRPALAAPRGEPRVQALFANWLAWGRDSAMPGGCILIAAAVELDDRQGPQREFLVGAQKEWLATLSRAARIAADEGHFAGSVDPDQFAFEEYGIFLAHHHARRLLRDRRAEARARDAFERLIGAARGRV